MNIKIFFKLLFLIAAVSAQDCTSKPFKGPCKANIDAWAYNPSTKQCIEFKYGGCEGNGNRYNKLSECELACKK